MPCIKTIGSIKIYVYLRDHNPPHFHMLYSGHEELITIGKLKNYAGSMPLAKRRKVIQWAKEHKEYLIEKWNEYNPTKKFSL